MLRRLAPLAGALIALVVLPAAASAVVPNPNPWLTKRFLNIAHQGGEDEAPSNTLFAFKSAMNARGADSIELDVNLSLDGDLMVIHDDTVNRITQETGPRVDGQSEVNDLTTAEVQALDGSYSFRPGAYDDSNAGGLPYPYRGIATGAVPPPAGYAATDFRIPTLREVLDAFPTTPINIEIKMIKTEAAAARIPKPGGCVTQGTPPDQHEYCDDDTGSIPVAEALADVLNEPQYASRTDIIVVSFAQELVQAFHDLAPQVALAPGVAGVVNYAVFGMTPVPDVAAFQVPPIQAGIPVPEALLQNQGAHQDGYAVHVWTNGDQDETDASYKHLVDLGVDGIMTTSPSKLNAYLCATEVPRPNGSDRCPPPPAAKKKCKKGKKLKKGKCVKKKRKKGKKKRR